MNLWILAALLNALAALAHIGIIFGGPAWYRFFGAGEAMAQMAERGHPWPPIITAGIATVLMVWAGFALALAGVLPPWPLMIWVSVGITAIYTLRGVGALVAMIIQPRLRTAFWWWSSLICTGFAAVHGLALWPLLVG